MRRLPPLYHVHHQSGALHSKKTPVMDWCPGWTPPPHPTTARIGSSPELDVKLRKWMDELWKSKTATYCASVSPFSFSISSSFFFLPFCKSLAKLKSNVLQTILCLLSKLCSHLHFCLHLFTVLLHLFFIDQSIEMAHISARVSPEAFLKSKHNHQIAEKSKQCIKCAHFCERRTRKPGNKPTTHKA